MPKKWRLEYPKLGCGDRLVRLADIPFERRIQALEDATRVYPLTPEEVERLMVLIADPGGASFRIQGEVENELSRRRRGTTRYAVRHTKRPERRRVYTKEE